MASLGAQVNSAEAKGAAPSRGNQETVLLMETLDKDLPDLDFHSASAIEGCETLGHSLPLSETQFLYESRGLDLIFSNS